MINVPQKRISQPQHNAGINYADPLASGLTSIFSPMSGNLFYNYMLQTAPTSDNGTARLGNKGFLRRYVSGTKASFANKANYGLVSANGGTIVIITDVDNLTNFGALASCQDTATTNGWELRLGNGGSDSRIIMHRSSASAFSQYEASASSIITAGTRNNFIGVSFTNNLATAPNYNVNGVAYAGSVAVGGAGTMTASTSTLDFGARASGTTQLDGAVLFAAFWNRTLSFAEMEAVRANPWRLFTDKRLYRYDALASGGVAFSARAPYMTGVLSIKG